MGTIRDELGRWDVKTVATAFAFAVQVAVLVWGASAMHSAIREQSKALEGFRVQVERQTDRLNDLSIRTAVLEAVLKLQGGTQ